MALPPNIALLHPDLESLGKFLLIKLLGDSGRDSSSWSELDGITPSSLVSAASYFNMVAIRKAILDPTFQFNNVAKHPISCSSNSNIVFVTGATDLAGVFMVHEFLEKEAPFCIASCVLAASMRRKNA